MHPGDMRRVEQIVDDIEIMAGDIHAAARGAAPGRIVEIRNVDDPVRVGVFGRAHPDPQQAPAVLHRIGSHPHAGRGRAFLRRGPHAGAAAVKGQAVIAAFDRVTNQPPLGQGQLAVRTGIFQRCRDASLGPEDDNGFIKNPKRR